MSSTKTPPARAAAGRSRTGAIYARQEDLARALRRFKPLGPERVEVRSDSRRRGIFLRAGALHAEAELMLEGSFTGAFAACTLAVEELRDAIAPLNKFETVTIERDGGAVSISASSVACSLLAGAPLGVMKAPEDRLLVHCAGNELALASAACARVCATDEHRLALCRVRMCHGERSEMVATDSYRLLITPLPGALGDPFEVFPDARLLSHAAKGLRSDEGVQLYADGEGRVQLVRGGERWRLASDPGGVFPEYRDIWPPGPEARFTVPRELLAGPVAEAARLRRRGDPLRVLLGADALELALGVPDGPDLRDRVPAQVRPRRGGQREFGVDPGYLHDLLSVMDGSQELVGEYAGPRKALVLRCGEDAALLMPILLGV